METNFDYFNIDRPMLKDSNRDIACNDYQFNKSLLRIFRKRIIANVIID